MASRRTRLGRERSAEIDRDSALAAVRSARGIRLGDPPAKILAIFGVATPRSVSGTANEKTLTFDRDRLTAMDYGEAC